MGIGRDEGGQALVHVVLAMAALMGSLALAVDVGQLLMTRRQLQIAADSAALAAALEIPSCGGTVNCAVMRTAAQTAMTENGYSSVTVVTQCASSAGTAITLQLNYGPCAMEGKDPNNGSLNYVEAAVFQTVPTLFGTVAGLGSIRISARAEAGLGPPQDCMYIGSTNAGQALLLNGGASLVLSQCGVTLASNSSTALLVNSGSTLTASSIIVHGGELINGTSTIKPTPVTYAAVRPDPLANYSFPSAGTCGTSTASPYTGSQSTVTVNSGNTAVFNAGTYCGGIQANGAATITFNPGLYVMNGSMLFNSGVNATGNQVTFYFMSGSLTMNGGGHANLVAPSTGTYAGMLLLQDRSDSTAMILNGDTTSVWQGVVYLPSAQLTLNGGSNLAAYSILDVNSMVVNSNVTFTLSRDFSSLPGGPPVHGTQAVLIE